MPSPTGSDVLERDPGLVVAGVYEREIEASLDSVWENVFDWEHLPWLHAQAFSSIELLDSGDWGWTADVGFPGGARAHIELVADRTANRYVARTLEGAGAPGEIWTRLAPVDGERTRIRVEFCVSPLSDEALEKVGAAYLALYAGLWDQDEKMMQTREQAFAARDRAAADPATRDSATESGVEPIDLGAWDDLAPRLPIVLELGGHRFRVVELEGRPVAHSVTCPHWLGPLEDCVVEAGVVTCPWHGYRFEVSSGESTEGRGLRLRPAPDVEVDAQTGRVRVVLRDGGEKRPEV